MMKRLSKNIYDQENVMQVQKKTFLRMLCAKAESEFACNTCACCSSA